ncbi:MAG TPA: response regulator transcription factor [Puia sp.]|nr:response regulator transcription factor [Puia sp.]
MSVINIAIADDHLIFRSGLKKCLEFSAEVTIVSEAADGKELLRQLAAQKTDIVLTDIHMPVMDGIEATRYIREFYPEVKVLALSMSEEEETIVKTIQAGANGYLVKTADPEEIVRAIGCIIESGYYFNKYVSAAMARQLSRKNETPGLQPRDDLNFREKEVLKLVCEERTNIEIARQLFVSPRTVEGYRSRLIEKSGARNIAGLVLFAIRIGIIKS